MVKWVFEVVGLLVTGISSHYRREAGNSSTKQLHLDVKCLNAEFYAPGELPQKDFDPSLTVVCPRARCENLLVRFSSWNLRVLMLCGPDSLGNDETAF